LWNTIHFLLLGQTDCTIMDLQNVMVVVISQAPQAYKYRPPLGHQANFTIFSYRPQTIKTSAADDNSRALNLNHTRPSRTTQDNVAVPARGGQAQHLITVAMVTTLINPFR